MNGGFEVIAMAISGVIGFIAGVVATILLRESPRSGKNEVRSKLHASDYDTAAHSVKDYGWGHSQVRTKAKELPDEMGDTSPHGTSEPNGTSGSPRKVTSETSRQPVVTPTTSSVPLHVTTKGGAPVAILTADSMGRRWLLRTGENATIGRFDDCTIAIDDDEVSRLHAQISHRTDTGEVHEFTIFDYTSTNGTLLNGKPIRGVASLQDGDLLRIGNTELDFHRVRRD